MPNILLLTANSKINPLRLLTEVEEIRAALGESSTFRLHHVNEVQSRDLLKLLLDHEPDILHFAGHGAEQRIMLRSGAGEAPLGASDLAAILQRLPIAPKMLVLNACFSADLSRALVPHVAAVVGAEGTIGDEAARVFSRDFYAVLGKSQSAATAFELARTQVNLAGYDGGKLQIKHLASRDPEELIFYARPQLLARFRLDKKDSPIRIDDDYKIDLWLRGVATDVDSVTYQVCHDSFEGEAFWEVKRTEAYDFMTDDFASFGDVTIRAVVWARERGLGIESTLAQALRRNYGDGPSSKIEKALAYIEDN